VQLSGGVGDTSKKNNEDFREKRSEANKNKEKFTTDEGIKNGTYGYNGGSTQESSFWSCVSASKAAERLHDTNVYCH